MSAASNPQATFVIESCAGCRKQFTTYANAPDYIERDTPHRHELMPNDILCSVCFARAEALADGAFF